MMWNLLKTRSFLVIVSNFLIIFVFLTSYSTTLQAKTNSKKINKSLPFPDYDHSLTTLEPSISGLIRLPDSLVLFVTDKNMYIVTPFKKDAKSRDERFGKLTDSTRKNFSGSFRGLAGTFQDGRLLMLDGMNLAMGELEMKSFTEIAWRSLPWDMIKPAKDRGGEASTPETNEFRAQFKKQIQNVEQPRIVGFSPLPSSWHKEAGTKTNYIVATKTKKALLGIISCSSQDASSCYFARGCNVEGAGGITPESIAGIAVSQKRGLLFMGDRKQNKLIAFKFHSCFHITREFEINLPAKIMNLSNILIDDEDQLWMTTERPDNYNNASLFYWASEDWKS